MRLLELTNVSKFSENGGSRIHVLNNINLEILKTDKGKIISILGPEGSGKSTLLKIISQIEKPSEGKVISDKVIPLIPEKPSSFLWLNVKENIKLAEELSGKKIEKNIDKIISLVGLEGYENFSPNEKSVGFRFRISLARALAVSPKIILIDDSLKLMSNESREEIQQMLLTIIGEINATFLFATANISEAIKISNKIFLMSSRPGRLFKEMKIDKNSMNNHEYFIEMRRNIENCFIEEKVVNKINFSV